MDKAFGDELVRIARTEWANMDDYELEYLAGIPTVTVRTKDDGLTTLGQIEWANRRIQEVMAEIPIGDIRSVMRTGIALEVILKDGKHMVIGDLEATDMWQEHKEAQFDEYTYKDGLQEQFDEILDKINDGIRERMDDDRINPQEVAKWAQKWKQMMSDMEEAIAKDDGVFEG